ncbi:uncharacterized protein HRG_11507 [Hirsutella rhossiliensis]|uniref:Probable beta-glucosidase btgE n=2 Tax=Hirsutella rhossiliensis TaxID=111463 RepID=A0A9P8MLP9_9HYPO|nr:uncharacterized protein HRG_11507 [Hirsutella rhossiliensis]KAH0957360.1 hypothetical protein HRG_11507 [Hirsutella rhossiliensis]
MKGGLAAAALAALAGGVSAAFHGHGHGHLFAKRSNQTGEVCLPECTTIWSVVTGEATLVPGTKTTTAFSTETTTITVPAINGAPVTPGVHTFPATTITVTEATTVCAAASGMVTAGTRVVSGVTTIVEGATNIECPVATVYNPGTYIAPEQVVTVTKTGYVYYCPLSKSGLSTSTPAPAPQPTEAVPPPPPASTYEAPAPSTEEEAPLPSAEVPVISTEKEIPAGPAEEKVPVTTQEEIPAGPAEEKVPVTTQEEIPTGPAEKKVPVTTHVEVPVAPSHKQTSPPAYSQPGPAPKHGDSGKLVSGNDHFGITYTPYQPSDGKCKSSEQVDKDISELKKAGFTTVRVYSTDCRTLENVGNACDKYKVQMIVGVFVKDKGCSYDAPAIKEQIDELSKWNKWGLVSLVVVGNEAIMNGHCSPRQLRDLITTVKSKCPSYKGKYTISETLNVWQRPDVKSEICGVVDVTGANIHPYFNSNVSPGSAGEFVAGQLDLLSKICGHNEVINLECGWPTRGNCNGKACPGKTQQAEAIKSIREKTGSKTVFFSYEDDMWKEAGSCGCEQSWGTAASFKTGISY